MAPRRKNRTIFVNVDRRRFSKATPQKRQLPTGRTARGPSPCTCSCRPTGVVGAAASNASAAKVKPDCSKNCLRHACFPARKLPAVSSSPSSLVCTYGSTSCKAYVKRRGVAPSLGAVVALLSSSPCQEGSPCPVAAARSGNRSDPRPVRRKRREG